MGQTKKLTALVYGGKSSPKHLGDLIMSENLIIETETEEIIDIEEYAKTGRKPPKGKSYRIKIDKKPYVVNVSEMTGRELLNLAGKNPATNYLIFQTLHGGEPRKIGLDENADFTTPGVERFRTLPLDQTDGELN